MTEGTPVPPFRMPNPGEMARRPMPGPPVPGPPPVSTPEPDLLAADADGIAESDDVSDEGAAPSPADSAPVEPVVGPRSVGTGDDRVDAALRRLDGLDELPISEHVEQYDAVHRTLQDALAAIDEG